MAKKPSSLQLTADFCAVCGGLDVPTSSVRGVALKVGVSEGRLWKATCERLRAATNTEERDQLIVALAGHGEKAIGS